MTVRQVGARFDDLRNGRALEFPQPERTLVARTVDEVADVLDAVEQATAAGKWAYGMLAYEAGPGVDRSLPVGHAPEVPYAWFALCEAPRRSRVVAAREGPRRYWMSSWRLDTDPHEHAGAVAHVQGLIAAGGVYQVNVTARAHATVRGDVFDLYRDLVHAQSASYNALLEIKGRTILSISPELFLD